jgi:hypothetical protein
MMMLGGRGGGEVEKYKSFWIKFEVHDSKFLAWKSVQHLTIEDHANIVPVFSSRVTQNALRVGDKDQPLNSV